MTLAEQWNGIESGLDPRWGEAELLLAVDDEARLERAAALLAPAGPGLAGKSIRITAGRGGASVGPEAVRRLLRRLDEEGISGTLELLSAEAAPTEHATARPALADAWDIALAPLPEDWSDLLCEVELTSSDHLERGALLLGPVNPLRAPALLGFRFRAAHSFGYGAAPGMVRRCLARLDEEGIPGRVRVLRALSDTHPVGTQGPVWTIGGKAV
jgi:hypothetical protein